MTPSSDELRRRIEDRTAVVGVLGLGYVGLPLSLTFAEQGFRVLGFDVDGAKVARIRAGESYIGHLDSARVAKLVTSGRLEATDDFSRVGEADALLVCVPTPVDENLEPDMRFVVETLDHIATGLRPGQLVVVESTTYPGTTDELVRPRLEANGLVCGRDFFLAFSPEREDPGRKTHTTRTIPKVVGGVDKVSGDLAEALYAGVVVSTVRVSSARAAEATKLTENVFRAVNIALVNELKVIFAGMGIDIWEVVDAASTKPFGFMRFEPGPGWGGHCVPIDPFYLAWKARQLGLDARFIELAGEINRQMPAYVVERARQVLEARGKGLDGSRVLIVGLAFKPNVADDRESASYRLMDGFAAAGAEVRYHDPYIPVIEGGRETAHWEGERSVDLDPSELGGFDLVVIATRHDCVDYEQLAAAAELVLDTRNALRGVPVPGDRVHPA